MTLTERFAGVETWVFDLDNTLYPSSADLWPKIDDRITAFIAAFLGIDGISARALQKYYYRLHGTTLRGLMQEYAIDPKEFLAFVHDIDRSSLKPNLPLASAMQALPGRKLILTNGSRQHALDTAEQLGIRRLFEDVFDIVDADLLPKPAEATYQRFFDRHGVDPTHAAMFEDIAHNLTVPHARGMVTTLVVPKQGQTDYREPWEVASNVPPHVDFVTDDLEGFLRSLTSVDSRAQPAVAVK
jgi:putative hydrolase of the HAD superfamily